MRGEVVVSFKSGIIWALYLKPSINLSIMQMRQETNRKPWTTLREFQRLLRRSFNTQLSLNIWQKLEIRYHEVLWENSQFRLSVKTLHR